MKQNVSLFLVIAFILGLIPPPIARANTIPDALNDVSIYAKDEKLTWLRMNGSTITHEYTYYNYRRDDGSVTEIPAYCVNPNLYGVPSVVGEGVGVGYTTSYLETNSAIVNIVASGYPHVPLADLGLTSVEEAYYATKTAVWIYLQSSWTVAGLSINSNLSSSDQAVAQRVKDAVESIYYHGINSSDVQTPSLTVSPDATTAYEVTINDTSYYQQIYTVNSATWCVEDGVHLSLMGDVPTGAKIVDMNNNEISFASFSDSGTFAYSGQFKVIYPVSSVEGKTGSFQINLDTNVIQYAIYYAVCAETDTYGNLQNYLIDTDPQIPIATSTISSYTDDPDDSPPPPSSGNLRIVKLQSGTLIPLAGATFEIITPDGAHLGSYTTDSTGQINLTVSMMGNYTITELVPPENHNLGEITTQNVTVKTGETAVVTFVNDPYGSLRIIKTSDKGEFLNGVTFEIKHIATGETHTGTTSLAGTVEFHNLPLGGYEVREISGIEGYIADTDTIQTVSVVSDVTVTVNFTNKEKPGLKIIKYDRVTMERLPDVTFEIFRNGASIGQYTTDAQGEILLVNQQEGTYTVYEVMSDYDHILDSNYRQVELIAGDGILELVFFNDKKPEMKLIKVDSQDLSVAIPNVKFSIEAVDGSFGPEEFITDSNGEINLSHLTEGAYKVTELLTADGYLIDDAERIIQLKANDTAEFVFTNTKKPSMELIKYDPDNKLYLEGATFRISKVGDGTNYLDRITDRDGKINIDGLDEGFYNVQEISAPDGYILNDTVYQVELFAGKTSTLVIENKKKPEMEIQKTDILTGLPLAGVTFTVAISDGATIATVTTDKDGKALITDLDVGVYEVTEVSVPDGYILDTTPKLVTLTPNQTAVVKFENYPKPSMELIKYDPENGRYLEGATFRISKVGDGTNYLDRITDKDGRINIDGLDVGIYNVQEISAPSGYILNDTIYQVELFAGKTSTLIIENNKKPEMEIQKTDILTGEPVAGVTFIIKKADGETVATVTTDVDGKALITDLDVGVYEVTEVSVPEGYILDSTPKLVTLSPNQTAVVKFENYPKPSLEVSKVNVDGGTIAGAVFTFAHKDGTIIGDYTTDKDGKFLIENLDEGYYILTEKSVPHPYILDTTPREVYLSAGKLNTLVIENNRHPNLTIKKVDSITNSPLHGAEFTIWYAVNGSLDGDLRKLGTYTTDGSGEIFLEAVEVGWYRIEETQAPSGYSNSSDNVQDVFLKADVDQTVTFKNTPLGALIIKKVDGTNGDVLQGAKFRLRYFSGVSGTEGTVIGEYETDVTGTIIINGLEKGTYMIQEFKAPDGYIIDDAPQTVYMTGESQDVILIEFENMPDSGLFIVKVDAQTNEPLMGATFKVETDDGTVVGNYDGIYTTDENGMIHIPNLPTDTYVVTELQAPNGYALDSIPQTVKLIYGETHRLTFANNPDSGLMIVKVDALTNELLQGATFKVETDDGTVVGNYDGLYTTDENGVIHIPNLPTDTYVVTELTAPEGYVRDAIPQTVKLISGETHRLTFANNPDSGLWIYKQDRDTKEPLAGAVFKVTGDSGIVVGNGNGFFTTDQDGLIHIPEIDTDTYVVVEVEAPEGYILDETPQTIKLINGETHHLYFDNEKIPSSSLLISKIDALTREPLRGATFRVVTKNGLTVGTGNSEFTTDSTGTILLTDLPLDTYVITEVKAPDGYFLDENSQTIELLNGEVHNLTFENMPYSGLFIHKSDKDTKEPLADAVFEVRTDDGLMIGTSNGRYTTDENGMIHLPSLKTGTYIVTEVEAPEGYLLSSTPQTVKLTNGETHDIYFTNEVIPLGHLVITKQDALTQDKLSGATFKLTTDEGVPVGNGTGEYTTDSSGTIQLSNLPVGTYVVTETKAPDGYFLDAPTQTITIKKGETTSITFENMPDSGLIVTKVDRLTNEPLYGATFKVTTDDGTVVGNGNGIYTTDEQGSFHIPNLPTDTYVVYELTAPDGYVLDNTPQTIKLIHGETHHLVFSNLPDSGLWIHKIDKESKESLAGAVFKVVTDDGSVVGNGNGYFTTDEYGLIHIPNLETDTYIVQEMEAPEGYYLDPSPQTVKLIHGETHNLTFSNEKIPEAHLIITKIDAISKTPLAGAVFEIRTDEGAVVGHGKYTTNENGYIHLTNLPLNTLVITEIEAPEHYLLDSTPQVVVLEKGTTHEVTFSNQPNSGLWIYKQDTDTKEPLMGAIFKVTKDDGTLVGNSNGFYTTDDNGMIHLPELDTDTYIVVEVQSPEGYILDATPQTIKLKYGETHELTFNNTKEPSGGLLIRKLDSDTRAPIEGVEFRITKKTGDVVGDYITDDNGLIHLPDLEPDWYTVYELKQADGYILDAQPRDIEVKDKEEVTLEIMNTLESTFLIHKVCSVTGQGLQGVVFLLYDNKNNPIGQYETDSNGYVLIEDELDDGQYFIRELKAADGYILDDTLRTFYVKYGETALITWENVPEMAQIQITKKSADHNPYNGMPAGTLLPDAVFEIISKKGVVVDTVKTDSYGRAVSSFLPLGQYTIREIEAPMYYMVDITEVPIELEFVGQIVKIEMLNYSASTNVSIDKTGYTLVTPNQTICYDFQNIGNNSTVALDSFYWRDTLPVAGATLDKIVTGTYNQEISYKVVFKTNLNDYKTLADNLSTSRNYVLEASPVALGLAADEYVTEFMFVFGNVIAGFGQVEAPQVYCITHSWLSNNFEFVNNCDVGGVHQGQWIMSNDRWVTKLVAPVTPPKLPQTGW